MYLTHQELPGKNSIPVPHTLGESRFHLKRGMKDSLFPRRTAGQPASAVVLAAIEN